LTGRGKAGWALAVLVGKTVFGLAQLGQGATGVGENVANGALLCLLYLATGRRLLVPAVAHAITDTIDSLIIFSGHYPGM
jgi:membrane protease YdiL (CAAX protease family)